VPSGVRLTTTGLSDRAETLERAASGWS